MTGDDFPYSRSLAPLASLLAGVKRPGDFCVHGALALPMLEEVLAVDGASAGAPALDLAGRIVAHWARQSPPRHTAGREGPLRARMLRCLARLGTTAPGERFLRESYRRQCRQHAEDVAAMRALQALAVAAPDAEERARLAAAVARQPQAVEG